MRRISVYSLKPGHLVARPVYNSSGQVLLQCGARVSKRYINRLLEMGVFTLYIEDDFSADIKPEDIISDELRMRSNLLIKNLFSRQKAGHARGQTSAEMARITAVVNDIIDELLANRSTMINLMDIRAHDDYLFGHSVNVCVLAVLTGIALHFSRTKLFHLAMGSLLHDIGITRLDRGIGGRKRELTAEERRQFEMHPLYGYEILSRDLHTGKLCAIIALQHHERYSGHGYPKGLQQDEIHEMAAITGLADMYDELTSAVIQQRVLPPNEVYEMISGAGDSLFAFNLVKAFLTNITPYPVGTLVKLNTGETAIVIENNKGLPLYPKIRVLCHEDGRLLKEPVELWLPEDRTKTIVAVVENLPGQEAG
ncbi:MAG TPA: HD domain-containing protein [Desulfotomaculum sp.]|nr:HD domain-containing protein [Desulfotomaculum sp.]